MQHNIDTSTITPSGRDRVKYVLHLVGAYAGHCAACPLPLQRRTVAQIVAAIRKPWEARG